MKFTHIVCWFCKRDFFNCEQVIAFRKGHPPRPVFLNEAPTLLIGCICLACVDSIAGLKKEYDAMVVNKNGVTKQKCRGCSNDFEPEQNENYCGDCRNLRQTIWEK